MSLLTPLDPPLHVVLVAPQIPPNTGNIARLCACTGCRLHLVEPLGFSIADKDLKRAGLDYWPHVFEELHPDLASLMAGKAPERFHFFSARATRPYFEARFRPGDFLVFGSETDGLPTSLTDAHPERTWAIPMLADRRSLNLATSAGIVTYEAIRQIAFASAGG